MRGTIKRLPFYFFFPPETLAEERQKIKPAKNMLNILRVALLMRTVIAFTPLIVRSAWNLKLKV